MTEPSEGLLKETFSAWVIKQGYIEYFDAYRAGAEQAREERTREIAEWLRGSGNIIKVFIADELERTYLKK
jgi:hypothetical protein